MKRRSRERKKSFLPDFFGILASILVAFAFLMSGVIDTFLAQTEGLGILGSFVAGMFFTSAFTTPSAIVALGKISLTQSIYVTAMIGAMGAVVGDLIIFKFLRNRVSMRIQQIASEGRSRNRFRALFKTRLFHWLTMFAGALIIASPLPDELGLALMGFNRIRTNSFIILSYTFNFIGIALIGFAARAIV